MRRHAQTKSSGIREWIEQFMSMRPCSSCNGTRLKDQTLAVTINNMNIGEVSSMSVKDISSFFKKIKLTKMEIEIADQILKEISQRLSF